MSDLKETVEQVAERNAAEWGFRKVGRIGAEPVMMMREAHDAIVDLEADNAKLQTECDLWQARATKAEISEGSHDAARSFVRRWFVGTTKAPESAVDEADVNELAQWFDAFRIEGRKEAEAENAKLRELLRRALPICQLAGVSAEYDHELVLELQEELGDD